MKTKTIELWCDLWPGWQDDKDTTVFFSALPPATKLEHDKRIRIVVELPCFGGSAEEDGAVKATAEITPEITP